MIGLKNGVDRTLDAFHADSAARMPDSQPEHESIRWRSLPLVDDFPKSALLIVILVSVAAGAAVSFQSLGLGALSLVLLLMSVARYFYPTYYALSESGVSIRSWLGHAHKPWSAFAGCYVHRVGVHLSPFGKPSPLDPFRGTFVRFAHNRDAVLKCIRQHLPPGRGNPSDPGQEAV